MGFWNYQPNAQIKYWTHRPLALPVGVATGNTQAQMLVPRIANDYPDQSYPFTSRLFVSNNISVLTWTPQYPVGTVPLYTLIQFTDQGGGAIPGSFTLAITDASLHCLLNPTTNLYVVDGAFLLAISVPQL